MRYKSWPYYKDWGVIFGKDRATGEGGNDWCAAAQKINKENKGKTQTSHEDDYVPNVAHISEDFDDDFMSACRGESASSPIKMHAKKTGGKKRNREGTEIDDKMVEMMSTYFERHTGAVEKLVEKLGVDESASMRKKVFDALDGMGIYELAQKLKVATVLWEKKDFEIFFTTTEANRQQLVWMILDGSY